MADPVTLATIATGATAAGGGVSAFSSLYGGAAQSGMYKYQAGVAQYNASLDASNAEYATNQGQQQAAQSGMQTRAQIGQTKAREGASNLDVNSGSSKDVVASERDIGSINTANILNNASRVAYNYRVQSSEEFAQAGVDRSAASKSLMAGGISAVGSLISTAGNVSSKWLQFGQSGIPGFGANNSSGSNPSLPPDLVGADQSNFPPYFNQG
jgi:hypothetical protein